MAKGRDKCVRQTITHSCLFAISLRVATADGICSPQQSQVVDIRVCETGRRRTACRTTSCSSVAPGVRRAPTAASRSSPRTPRSRSPASRPQHPPMCRQPSEPRARRSTGARGRTPRPPSASAAIRRLATVYGDRRADMDDDDGLLRSRQGLFVARDAPRPVRFRHPHPSRTGGRGRRDRAVEHAAVPDRHQADPGTAGGLPGNPQTRTRVTAGRAAARRDARRSELPPGGGDVLPGDASVGAALVGHPGVDKVSFTGSTAAGRSRLRAPPT